jgi:haloalkane dehalogenase
MVRPFDRYLLQVGDYRMHVMERGTGMPVLLLHGNPTWGFLYRKVAAALEGEPLRLIMPDLVGLGFSERPRESSFHSLERHANQIAALMDALELERVIFVGQDWGGPIGCCALAARPERLAGLVVLNTMLGPPKPGFRGTWFHRFSRIPIASEIAFRLFGFPQGWMATAQGDRSSISGEVSDAYQYPLRGIRNNAAPLALARMVPDSMEHESVEPLRRCQQFVESFRGPAAIVWGKRDPILGRVLARTERLLPNAPVTATTAGHFLQEQVPGEIAEAIRGVANRVAEFPTSSLGRIAEEIRGGSSGLDH